MQEVGPLAMAAGVDRAPMEPIATRREAYGTDPQYGAPLTQQVDPITSNMRGAEPQRFRKPKARLARDGLSR